MVNDLVTLFKGVQIKPSNSIFSSVIVRAALGYISSDLPATRKLCGFYATMPLTVAQSASKCFLVVLALVQTILGLIEVNTNNGLTSLASRTC